MELKALRLSLCRTPAFSINDNLENVWPTLKAEIKRASPSFYEEIEGIEFHEIIALPVKVQFTIWKYFNRAKYRATPFAKFASYTVVGVNDKATKLSIEAEMQSHAYTNWQLKEEMQHVVKATYKNAELIYSNTSVYETNSEIRYLRLNNGSFELASIGLFTELRSLVKFCTAKRTKPEIYEFMKLVHELNPNQCKTLLLQLIDLQVFHTDKTANITGEDYFKRLAISLPSNEEYILAERKLIGGALATSPCALIAEALVFLAQHLPQSQNNDLLNFKSAFLKKFEHQEVSLAIVMDPELGVGYGNLAQYARVEGLIDQLENTVNKKQINQSINYTSLHQFLINSLIEGSPINLEKFEKTTAGTATLPNTLSVVCHFYKNQPVIANAGGCTANSLVGRFTLANEELEKHCKEIAGIEQNANPDVLFFDIPYQAETHIDNVNRRKSCYDYELPILTWSCHEEPLDFNDVMVSVKGDEIILCSKKLGKRLIPRLASAYNYNRSDLAVYRFLCDLQHQSIQSNLTFDFQGCLNGLNYYPRVGYKNVILSPAKWLLPKSLYQQKKQQDSIAELKAWLNYKSIHFFVKTGFNDQTLCFNPSLPSDLNALITYCKQQGDRSIYLTEALIDEENAVMDQDGKKYQSEFVINYTHNKQIYQPVNSTNALSVIDQTAMPTHYLPGSEWLYFEIFIDPSKSNTLLRSEINKLLKAHKTDIKKWFFIRYHENGNHLRFRLHIADLTQRMRIIDNLNALLIKPMLNGIVKDVAIRTYRPELARYGALRMANIEHFFYLDSKHVLSLLTKSMDKNDHYQYTLAFINQIMSICFPIFKDRLSFVMHMSEAFTNEFDINKDGFKKINQAYAVFKNKDEVVLGLKQLEQQAYLIFSECLATEKPKLLADLIHMHVNRIFDDNQRLHEAICYQFLYKQLLTVRARSTAQAEFQASA